MIRLVPFHSLCMLQLLNTFAVARSVSHVVGCLSDYVLELCSGGELFTVLQQYGHFDLPLVQFYTAELLLALQYLHEHQVVHRDIKVMSVISL